MFDHIPGKSFDKTVYWSEERKEIAGKAFIFETLLSLANETVQSYRSDFYHDAFFLENLTMDKALTFFYCFGESGTTIIRKGESNLSPESLAMQCRKYGRPFVYKIELITPAMNSMAWTVRYTCLANNDMPMPPYNERISFNSSAVYAQRKYQG